MLFFVYRGSVSFTLAARAEGELVDNSQVTLMMKLSLCMIWISVFQHLLLSIPFAGLSDAKRKLIEGSESSDDEEGETAVQWVNDWLYRLLVIPKRGDDSDGIGLELSESEKEVSLFPVCLHHRIDSMESSAVPEKENYRPLKRYFRQRAHCNPLSHNDTFT